MAEIQRPPAEQVFAHELAALKAGDRAERPAGWVLSPKTVVTDVLGGKAADDIVTSPKYEGSRRLIETAVATLATDRALLLLGVPGTANSWASEHLVAGKMGDSTMVVECTSVTEENQIRYGWNYAQLLAKGPSADALVPTLLYCAMAQGKLCRLEELTRTGQDGQDTEITILSEKMMPAPELNSAVYAIRGFNIIATANDRDKGVNELSSALKRRFNVVVLPLPSDIDEEVAIVTRRLGEMGSGRSLPVPKGAAAEVERIVTIFRELRDGKTLDGKIALKAPPGSLSTDEAIAVMVGGYAKRPAACCRRWISCSQSRC